MDSKTKITEIREKYTVNRPTTNSAGERIYEEKNFIRFLDVRTVEGWPRFGHFMLDRIFFYIFCILIGFVIGLIDAFTGIGFLNSSAADIILQLFTYFILFPGYYLFFEYFMQSSPGKLILGRIVVDEYGEKPSFNQILARSFSRIVPFEAFSCLSELGWHDKWSDTMVIRKKDLYELQLAIKAQEFGSEPKNTII